MDKPKPSFVWTSTLGASGRSVEVYFFSVPVALLREDQLFLSRSDLSIFLLFKFSACGDGFSFLFLVRSCWLVDLEANFSSPPRSVQAFLPSKRDFVLAKLSLFGVISARIANRPLGGFRCWISRRFITASRWHNRYSGHKIPFFILQIKLGKFL